MDLGEAVASIKHKFSRRAEF